MVQISKADATSGKFKKPLMLLLCIGICAVILIVQMGEMDNLEVTPWFPDVLELDHKVAGLNCRRYGGPSEEVASEMVYWRDIPEDSNFTSPFANYGPEPKYLTFEPDEGGWNNIRMSMETAVVLAHAMGRILVLPPARPVYLLWDEHKKEKNKFTFNDFFHFDSLAKEHESVDIISMDEFLKREGLAGNLKDQRGVVRYPSHNITTLEYEGGGKEDVDAFHEYLKNKERQIWKYLRSLDSAPIWNFDRCIVAIPEVPGPDAANHLLSYDKEIKDHKLRRKIYRGKPTEVDAPPLHRMKEMLGPRKLFCLYDDFWQKVPVIHFMGDNKSGARLLTHFYSFVFFENWKQDVWTKRFVRDHLRYVDEIQCAAARIVNAVREKSREHGNEKGEFDSFHIRRGDFQYGDTRIDADQIYKNIQDVFVEGATVFIATDEKDKKFFNHLRLHYHVYFMDDFSGLLTDLNKNYYGMVDQLIAARGRAFAGSFYSTFTGYINRIRGYHSQKEKLPGYEKGGLQSYFYVPLGTKSEMLQYEPIYPPMWAREFPVGWRDIDHDVTSETKSYK